MSQLRLSFPNLMAQMTTLVDAEYHEEIEKARRELRARISSNNGYAPLFLLLALHHAGSYDAETETGGPNRSMNKAVNYCATLKGKHKKVSYADLYQLAGVVAVEVTGGPTIDFVPGRQDSKASRQEGLFPYDNQDASHLRKVFHPIGLTDKEIVAICGGYTWAEAAAHGEKGSGSQEPSTKDHLKFDNSYFVELWKSKASDKALVKDPEFRKYVEKYAQDEDAFFSDYVVSHKKLSELGLRKHANMMANGVIGIFIASTVVMLGYIFEVNRRSN